MTTDTPRIPEQGVATLPDKAWERARRRAEIIGPLAQSETVGHEAADMAAQALGLSRRQVYVLIRRAPTACRYVSPSGYSITTQRRRIPRKKRPRIS